MFEMDSQIYRIVHSFIARRILSQAIFYLIPDPVLSHLNQIWNSNELNHQDFHVHGLVSKVSCPMHYYAMK
jgi:hypothetical protein